MDTKRTQSGQKASLKNPEQFTLGLSQEDYEAIEDYAEEHEMTIEQAVNALAKYSDIFPDQSQKAA